MKQVLVFCLLLYSSSVQGQRPGLDAFVRLPQVVNYNLTQSSASYTPVVSTGITLHYRRLFADAGIFINKGDQYDYYTYFGSGLREKQLDDHWRLVTNWFGEVTCLPRQPETENSWTHTLGVSPVLVKPFGEGSVAIALTLGAALSSRTISLNSRIVLNCSLPLIKPR